MTTPSQQTVAWATKYRELLKGYVELLGGKAITPTRRALAGTISTLQCELSMLTDRFASSGRGGSPDDIALFLKLSNTVAELMHGAGLSPSQQQPVSDTSGGDDALKKLTAAFSNIMHQRAEERAEGVFRDADGSLITDPLDLELEKQIYALTQRRGHLHDTPAPLLLSPPSTPTPASASTTPVPASTTPAPEPKSPAPKPAPSTPAPKPLTPAQKAQAAEAARRRAMEPMFPAPSEPDSTSLFYEQGGGPVWWGPIGGGGGRP